jgi:uncharacterized membrane protein
MNARVRLGIVVAVAVTSGCADRSVVGPVDPSLGEWRLWSGVGVLALIVLNTGFWVGLRKILRSEDKLDEEAQQEFWQAVLSPLFAVLASLLGLTILGEWAYRFASWIHSFGWIGSGCLALSSVLTGFRPAGVVASYIFYFWIFPDAQLAKLTVLPGLATGMILTVLMLLGVQVGAASKRRQRLMKDAGSYPGDRAVARPVPEDGRAESMSWLSEQIVDRFELQEMIPAKRAEMSSRIGKLVFQATLLRVLPTLSEDDLSEYDRIVNDGESGDVLLKFMSQRAPAFEKIIVEELERLRTELQTVGKSVGV